MGSPAPIGIVAGSGTLPIDAAQAILARGGSVHVAMVEDLADASLRNFPHTVVNWAQVDRTMSAFKAAGVRDVMMLGATGRPSFRNARPDWGFLKALPTILGFLNAGGDDAVLRGLVALFETNGLNIGSPAELAPELLIGTGALTQKTPAARDEADIATGFALIAALGPYDIGQGVIIVDGRIAAIEAAEGTDRMLKRLAAAAPRPDRGVLVKRPKPGQDMRVDLPTIGSNTVLNAEAAGLAGIAVMSHNVLAAGRHQMIADADSRGLFIVGKDDVETLSRSEAQSFASNDPRLLSVKGAAARERVDMPRAAEVARMLSSHGLATVVIVEKRVMSIGVGEPPRYVIERASLLKRPKKRKGLAALGSGHGLDRETVRAAHEANLAGVIVIGPAGDTSAENLDAISRANEIGLFVACL